MLVHPAKVFDYSIEIDGVDELYVQNIEIPELSFEIVEHGAAGNQPNKKTAGKATVGDLVIEKLLPANTPDFTSYDWYAQVLSGQPALYARTGLLKQMNSGSLTPVRIFLFTDAWISKIETTAFNAQNSENMKETMTLSINNFYPQNAASTANFRQFWERVI